MSAMWLYLKENVKCGTKLYDVLIGVPERCRNRKHEFRREELGLGWPACSSLGDSGSRAHFQATTAKLDFTVIEMEIGDPSRKIVEIIFQKASMDPSRPASSRIKSILRVKNSIQTLERFKKYREKVKTTAYDKYTKQPRSMVDGNQLLKFYGTRMCCRSQRSKQASELCKNPACRVCTILQSHFGVEHALSIGIQLSSSSEDFSENVIPITKMTKNTERAAIVCRTIAGSLNSVNSEEYNEYDFIGNQKPNYNSGNV